MPLKLADILAPQSVRGYLVAACGYRTHQCRRMLCQHSGYWKGRPDTVLIERVEHARQRDVETVVGRIRVQFARPDTLQAAGRGWIDHHHYRAARTLGPDHAIERTLIRNGVALLPGHAQTSSVRCAG